MSYLVTIYILWGLSAAVSWRAFSMLNTTMTGAVAAMTGMHKDVAEIRSTLKVLIDSQLDHERRLGEAGL